MGKYGDPKEIHKPETQLLSGFALAIAGCPWIFEENLREMGITYDRRIANAVDFLSVYEGLEKRYIEFMKNEGLETYKERIEKIEEITKRKMRTLINKKSLELNDGSGRFIKILFE